MESYLLTSYLPQDRLRALARGEDLPEYTTGSALFADISGFTPLTEMLTYMHSSRRGIEALTQQINAVYEALITTIERYGGSVVSFAGDAITCWFGETGDGRQYTVDGEEKAAQCAAARRAAVCAAEIQAAMAQFPDLELKVAVTSGPARRFVVGDPKIQWLDALTGATIARLETAEHLAAAGEIILDAATAELLARDLACSEWRAADNGERFAVLSDFGLGILDCGLAEPAVASENPQSEIQNLKSWLLPAVWEREHSGHSAFLTELRPVVALFLRFTGIDYDHDVEAWEKLDALIWRVQNILAQYEGALFDMVIGDKGSYLYAGFGAPVAHEDDARRAAQAALDLRAAAAQLKFLPPVQIGLSQGAMRVGAYGSATRRTYSVFGDEANLAARLMQAAAPGQILLSAPVHQAVKNFFVCQPLPPLMLKGKEEPVPAWSLRGLGQWVGVDLHEPAYTLPMLGRERELALVQEKLALAVHGQGQIVGITAEAGMGKSRLVAEIVRLTSAAGAERPTVYAGACQSYGLNIPYLVWRDVWRGLFGLDATASPAEQIHAVECALTAIDPQLLPRAPLLSLLLDLPIPDTDLTRALDAKLRKESLEALLVDCLKARAARGPVMLILEDLHWLDALSHDLLVTLGQVCAALPVLFVLAYRPAEAVLLPPVERPAALRVEALPHFTRIALTELPPAACAELIQSKLAQFYPLRREAPPAALVEVLTERAQGNPFYLEELLNYLHEQGLNLYHPTALDLLELPPSLYTLILSRIDRLTERQKTTLRVASIIGRRFRAAWLPGYYPALGELAQVRADLDVLARQDITPLDTPEPELLYLFKHIVTHQVAYESLPYATRAQLHEQLARYLETQYAAAPPLDLLVYHYGLSDNQPKKIEYLRQAVAAARAAYANEAALGHYEQLLPLLTAPGDQIDLQLEWGTTLELMGQWAQAEPHYWKALTLAQQHPALTQTARCQLALGRLNRLRGDYAVALQWLAPAQTGYAALDDQRGLSETMLEMGRVYEYQGDYALARQHLEAGLAQARTVDDKPTLALTLIALGALVCRQNNYPVARQLYMAGLALQRELSNKRGIASALNNLGNVALGQSDYGAARALYAEGLTLCQEVGFKFGISAALSNLGQVAYEQGDYVAAQKFQEKCLYLKREIGNKWGIAASTTTLGAIAMAQGNYADARTLLEEGLELVRAVGDKASIAENLYHLGNLNVAQGDYPAAQAQYETGLTLARELGDKRVCALILIGWSMLALTQGEITAARQRVSEGLRLYAEIGDRRGLATGLVGLAAIALQMGETGRAVRLASAADGLRVALQAALEPIMQPVYARTVATAREQLGEEAFAAAWTKGEQMSLEAAAAEALEDSVEEDLGLQ